jgi:outer membrane protein OmpA-like peptidoglycan-associated protein
LAPIESANVFIFPLPSDITSENDLFEVVVEAPESNAAEFRLRYQLKKDINKEKVQLTTDSEGRLRNAYKSEQRYLIQVEKTGYYAIQHLVDIQAISDLDGLVFYMQPIVSKMSVINVQNSDGTAIENVDVLIRNASTDEQLMGRTNNTGKLQIGLVDEDIYMITASRNGYVTENVVGKGHELTNLVLDMEKISSFEAIATDRFAKSETSDGSTPIIVLEDIYYDLDDYTIKAEYAYELKLLADLLKRFPDIRVELIAHTDARGSDAYNLDLSVKRAETAKQFLVDLEIDPKRLESKGVGESQLRNHCADNTPCSEEEHKYNRRTEVKVIDD